MFQVFQSESLKKHGIDDENMTLYIATLELIARSSFGPSAYFDLAGHNSGITVPTLDTFPSAGYTFCVWIRMESLDHDKQQPLFAFWYVPLKAIQQPY